MYIYPHIKISRDLVHIVGNGLQWLNGVTGFSASSVHEVL